MSSFGSQARLAELTAAASARERQAKRELEEQNRPPKSAPISLSAFTKTVSNSGNRGTKTYRPLTLEDIKEQEVQQTTASDGADPVEEEQKAVTSIQPVPFVDVRRTASAVLEAQRSKQVRSQTRIDPPYTADLVPLHPSFHMTAMQQIHPMTMQPQIPIPYQAIPQSAPPDREHYPFRNIMVPEDISPSKQEEKFMAMSKENDLAEQMHSVMQGQDDPQPYPNYSCQVPDHSGHHDNFHMQMGRPDLQQQNSTNHNQHHFLQQYPSHNPVPVRRNSSNMNVTPSRSVSGRTNTPASIAPAMNRPIPEAYETSRELGRVIAEEAVRSRVRRGKTVTYNPDRYSEDSSGTSGNVSSGRFDQSREIEDRGSESRHYLDSEAAPMTPEIPVFVNEESRPGSSAMETALRNPAPGLPFPTDVCPPELPELDLKDAKWDEDMAALRANADFMSLQPPNAKDRRRTREVMVKAAKQETTYSPDPVVREIFEYRKIRLSETAVWFRSDNRGSAEVRHHLERNVINQEALRRRQSTSMQNNGVLPPDFKIGVDDGLVTNLSLSHVYANLETYLSTDSTNPQKQDQAFHKVKSVPDWATARTDEEKTSYFSGNKGWLQPPPRIARDPRFRPAPAPPMAAVMPMPITPARPISRARTTVMPGVGEIGARVGGSGISTRGAGGPANFGVDGHGWQQKVDSLFAGRRM